MFNFRRAEVSDKARICDISSKIWDGTDYIPYVFDEWVSDYEGEFTVAEYEGEIIGFAKYSRIAANEAWLEGIRADKSFSGKGFGTAMTNYFINKAKSESLDTLRLSTYIENYSSINVIEKCGFKKDGCFSYCSKELNISDKKASKANIVKIMSPATAWRFIENSRFFMLSNAYIADGWRFYKLSYEPLENLVRTGKVLGTIKNGTITAMAIIMGDASKGEEFSIGFMDGEKEDKTSLFDYIESKAVEGKVQSIEFMSVLDDELIDALSYKGYRFEYDKPRQANVFVYTCNIK